MHARMLWRPEARQWHHARLSRLARKVQHSRALPPTLPWTRRARCCRRRDKGMCSSATVEAFCTRPPVGTGAYVGSVLAQFRLKKRTASHWIK